MYTISLETLWNSHAFSFECLLFCIRGVKLGMCRRQKIISQPKNDWEIPFKYHNLNVNRIKNRTIYDKK